MLDEKTFINFFDFLVDRDYIDDYENKEQIHEESKEFYSLYKSVMNEVNNQTHIVADDTFFKNELKNFKPLHVFSKLNRFETISERSFLNNKYPVPVAVDVDYKAVLDFVLATPTASVIHSEILQKIPLPFETFKIIFNNNQNVKEHLKDSFCKCCYDYINKIQGYKEGSLFHIPSPAKNGSTVLHSPVVNENMHHLLDDEICESLKYYPLMFVEFSADETKKYIDKYSDNENALSCLIKNPYISEEVKKQIFSEGVDVDFLINMPDTISSELISSILEQMAVSLDKDEGTIKFQEHCNMLSEIARNNVLSTNSISNISECIFKQVSDFAEKSAQDLLLMCENTEFRESMESLLLSLLATPNANSVAAYNIAQTAVLFNPPFSAVYISALHKIKPSDLQNLIPIVAAMVYNDCETIQVSGMMEEMIKSTQSLAMLMSTLKLAGSNVDDNIIDTLTSTNNKFVADALMSSVHLHNSTIENYLKPKFDCPEFRVKHAFVKMLRSVFGLEKTSSGNYISLYKDSVFDKIVEYFFNSITKHFEEENNIFKPRFDDVFETLNGVPAFKVSDFEAKTGFIMYLNNRLGFLPTKETDMLQEIFETPSVYLENFGVKNSGEPMPSFEDLSKEELIKCHQILSKTANEFIEDLGIAKEIRTRIDRSPFFELDTKCQRNAFCRSYATLLPVGIETAEDFYPNVNVVKDVFACYPMVGFDIKSIKDNQEYIDDIKYILNVLSPSQCAALENNVTEYFFETYSFAQTTNDYKTLEHLLVSAENIDELCKLIEERVRVKEKEKINNLKTVDPFETLY